MNAGQTGLYLIVPEQYSHDAERQLVDICGDRLPLYGEALSFSRLCTRVFTETGGVAVRELDNGGLMLVMYRALEAVASRLSVFKTKGRKSDLLENLLHAVKEFKSLNITADELSKLATRLPDKSQLRGKLHDLSLIFGAYDAILHSNGTDHEDRLLRLIDRIPDSEIGAGGHIYFDGYNDFTALELCVVEEFLRKGADMTVCLTSADSGDEEVFDLTRRTANQLRKLAAEHGVEIKEVVIDATPKNRAAELIFLEKHLFTDDTVQFDGDVSGAVELHAAATQYAECEYAAEKILQLIGDGYRWRDIAVMVRNIEEYGPICENVFEKYGIQFFSSGRVDILNRPPVALIDAALAITSGAWEYRTIFRYLKTGLAGIETDDCCELENYVLKWNVRHSTWGGDFTLPPTAPDIDAALERINELRRKVTAPLFKLQEGMKKNPGVSGKLCALYEFFEDIQLPVRLEEKAHQLAERGEMRLADEYEQLWEIIKNAMEQMFEILGDAPLSSGEFRKLFTFTLSQYDVGVIPTSLDRTILGGMAMSRRRDLRCLILLGATDDNMPKLTPGGGILVDREREELLTLSAKMPSGFEERLSRELNMIYSTLTLPSQKLIVSYPETGSARPSFIVKKMTKMFAKSHIRTENDGMNTALNGHQNTTNSQMTQNSQNISKHSAAALYGESPSLSPSRVDKYYSCPFAHFLQSGLKLVPRTRAGFDAPEAGTFLHRILEGVSRDIKSTVGFKNADEELCREISVRHIEKYVADELMNFEGRNERFVYLFRRLGDDALRIAADMVSELKTSDFEPIDFELRFDTAEDELKIKGIADRVDGWQHEEKLYLRVIDYKTGKKTFNLTDVLHGRDMQMLIYLFALQQSAAEQYGKQTVPAGVLYVPARDVILRAGRNATDEELQKKRDAELRRHGLILDNPIVIEAMEHGDKKYLPVKAAKDGIKGDNLLDSEQFARLSEHIGDMFRKAGEAISDGDCARSPYYKSELDNACLYCQYRAICRLDEDIAQKRRYVRKMKPEEIWEALEALEAESYENDNR